MLEQLIKLDTELFLFLNGLHSSFWDVVMYYVSEKLTWLPLYIAIVYYMVKKDKKQVVWTLLAIGVLIAAADQVSVKAFKEVFERLRPSHNEQLKDVIHLVRGHRGGTFGFVSSHAANVFAVAIFTILYFRKKWYTFAILAWAVWVSYSRIYLGVHYPGDVLCGGILGSLIGYSVFKLYSFLKEKYLL